MPYMKEPSLHLSDEPELFPYFCLENSRQLRYILSLHHHTIVLRQNSDTFQYIVLPYKLDNNRYFNHINYIIGMIL